MATLREIANGLLDSEPGELARGAVRGLAAGLVNGGPARRPKEDRDTAADAAPDAEPGQ